MPDNEPATDKGPVRILKADDGWYWVSRLELESPMVGPFTSFGLAVTNATEHGYTYKQPYPELATPPLNPPEQNEALWITVRSVGKCYDSVSHGPGTFKRGLRTQIVADLLEDKSIFSIAELQAALSAWNKRAG